MSDDFTFNLGDAVAVGNFLGTVIGVAGYTFKEDSFMIAYTNQDGLPCEGWFEQYAITKVTKH